MSYKGAAAKGYKFYGMKKYKLWGWLTSSDKRDGKIVAKLQKDYFVRVNKRGSVYAVWVYPKN